VIFSAHGVPKAVPAAADARGLNWLDATCPLVSKVHRQAERLVEASKHIIFVGHHGHPEVIGTYGQVPAGSMTVIESVEDVAALPEAAPGTLGYLTQTTLSVDDTQHIIEALIARFPDIQGPKGEDICYATSNRQDAVKAVTEYAERLIVIGAPNSSNSLRLAEVGERRGIPARLIERATDLDFDWLGTPQVVGLTAGASAPEQLVREVVEALATRFEVTEQTVETATENMVFKLPRQIAEQG
jgi:4-hydroxy-3-methylbut-2-enyl diphosphate reductase